MPEPITMTTVGAVAGASAIAGTGVVASEGAVATAGAVAVAEVAGHAALAGEVAGLTAVGVTTTEAAAAGTTEAAMGALNVNASVVGESILSRADASGAALSEALGTSTRGELATAANPIDAAPKFDVGKWVGWKPEPGERLLPAGHAERFRPLSERTNLEPYVKQLAQRDQSFGDELVRRERQLLSAQSPGERDAAVMQVRKSTAGKLGESIAKEAFEPYFERVNVQRVVVTENGVTKIDLRLEGAREPIVFGRGLHVEKGGNLSIEVKVGTPGSLVGQLRHAAEHQVRGHTLLGDRSLVLVSRDVHAMSEARVMRDAVADAGSRVLALLPEKQLMDATLLHVLREGSWR